MHPCPDPTVPTECSVCVDQDEGTVVDMRVMICARCAKVLNRAEEGSELTGATAAQVGWLGRVFSMSTACSDWQPVPQFPNQISVFVLCCCRSSGCGFVCVVWRRQ